MPPDLSSLLPPAWQETSQFRLISPVEFVNLSEVCLKIVAPMR